MAQKRTLSQEQDIAANPTENVWVQANAGTGKTSVLVQRLLRILFRGDITHAGILCLTYTNAGASEMRNRILAALRTWVQASDDELIEMLSGISENQPATCADAAHAREIFFKYIDNPELLKIKTIHGFCEEILRRFPIEAGVSPSWMLISDANQRMLLQDAFSKLINSSLSNMADGARVTSAFSHIVGRISETYLTDLMDILSSQYKYFFDIEDNDNYRNYFIDTTWYFLNLDNAPNISEDTKILKNIVNMAMDEQNTLKKPAKYLDTIVNLIQQYIDKTIDFEKYKTAYLKADGNKIQAIEKKSFLEDEQERVYQINQHNANKQVFDDTVALFDLSSAFAKTYRDMKRARNLLDFEDLILYTRRLFSSPENMGWVLSQLDMSLSHILVDEAQDTSPAQWDIMRMLAGDFFVGGDTMDSPRSLFVVGDSKQSIYGFQGADPAAFTASREDIARHIKQNLRTIREVPLTQSFRSLSPILRVVDEFFGDDTTMQLTGFNNNRHACFRKECGGLVEMHKLVSKQDTDIDITQYVRDIADKIKSLIESGKYSARDIMVLVQKRHPMAAPLVSELKRRNIDVAGSDRIVLPNFPAVRDMMNIVRFCLNNADDYSLCCVLKSPIYRLKEQDIYNLCQSRNNANKVHADNAPDATKTTVFDILPDAHPEIFAHLVKTIENSKNMGPFSFFSNLLNNDGVRENMIAALGTQIIDPLEEFLTICLSYERTQPGTLYHFIKWFITGASEIKRDMDAAAGVRIATVHGSKGLEAPVIFLIDTVRTPDADAVLPIPENEIPIAKRAKEHNIPNAWIWSPRGTESARRKIALDAAKQDDIAEYYRLLYVAMTRARDRLYIYGHTPYKNAPEIAWHTQLWRVLSAIDNANITQDTIRITDDTNAA